MRLSGQGSDIYAAVAVAYDRWRDGLIERDWQGRPIAEASAESRACTNRGLRLIPR